MRGMFCSLLMATVTFSVCSSSAQQQPAALEGQILNSGVGTLKLRSLHLTGEPAQVIQQALHLYGIDVLFAGPMPGANRQLHLDLVDADLTTTGEVLAGTARCFFVPLGTHLVMAVQDDKLHRLQYQPLFTETIEQSVCNFRRRKDSDRVQFGSISVNDSLTLSSTRQLQSAKLQLAEGQTGKLRVGQRYPFKTASTTAVGASASTPSVQYEDLGLTLEARTM